MSFYQRWLHRWEHRLTLLDRNRRIFAFDWGQPWLGEKGNGNGDPLTHFKDFARRSIQNSEAFFMPPPESEFSLIENRLTFPTPTPTPYPENNLASCRVFSAPGARKAVIVLPQWNADAQSHVALCRVIRRLGMTAVRLTLPYHEERLPPGMVRADYMVSPNVGRTLHATRQAVLEVRQVARWLQREGYQRIGILGTSIGSCVGFLAFVHEPILCTGVFNHVSAFFADVVWQGLSTRYVRWGLEGKITLGDLRECWAPISPLSFLPRLKKSYRPHLLITARYDLTFLPDLTKKVVDGYADHNIPCHAVSLPCGHYTTAKFPFKYLDGWHICRYLATRL